MTTEIRCQVFRIVWPDWSLVTSELKEAVWEIISQGVREGHPPSRRGFVGTSRLNQLIAGFFAHEDTRLGVQYDNQWVREELAGEEFEHLFFALVLDQGQVVLQRKRVDREFVSINLNTMRRAFFDLLCAVLQKAGLETDRVVRQPFEQTRDKAEMLRIFEEHRITYVRIGDLLGKRVPQDVVLFNPAIDKDSILKQALDDDFQHLDELEASSGEDAADINLRQAKIIRAAMLAGEPQEIRALVAGEEKKFRLTQKDRFDMQFDTPVGESIQGSDLDRLIRIVQTEYFVPASLVQTPIDLGPLFDDTRDDDEDD